MKRLLPNTTSMKSIFSTLSLLALTAIMIFSTACEKLEDDIQNVSQSFADGQTLNEVWHIHQYIDDYNETYLFAGVNFEFSANGEVKAVGSNLSVNGSWGILNQMNRSRFFLSFGNHPLLSELNDDDWVIVQKNDSIIELHDDYEILIFKKGAGSVSAGGNSISLEDSVLLGNWEVHLFLDDGIDNETYLWNNVHLVFTPGQLAMINTQGNTLANGTWFTTTVNGQKLAIIRIQGHPLTESLQEDWTVAILNNGDVVLEEHDEVFADHLHLRRATSNGNGSGNSGGQPNPSSGDSTLLGTWTVASFIEEGQYDETYEWNGLQLHFSLGQLHVKNSTGQTLASGSWTSTVYMGHPVVVIHIQGNDPIRELNEEWRVRVLSNGQLELVEHDELRPDRLVLQPE